MSEILMPPASCVVVLSKAGVRVLPPVQPIPPHWFDLQMFSAEDEGRTEEATGKKVSKARGEGQVAKSHEINQALALLVAGMIAVWILPQIVGYEMNFMRFFLQNLFELEVSQETLRLRFIQIGLHLLVVIWPIALAEIIVAFAGNIAQVGWLFTWTPLQPKWNKLFPNPKKLIDRMLIGKTMAFNLAKSLVKLIFIGMIAYDVIVEAMPRLLLMWNMQPYQVTEYIIGVGYEIIWKTALFLLVIAGADYWYNRYQWKDSLKMRKEEVKDEHRQSEGDPQIKRAQRMKMMQIARRRMLREVPTADVVITNPTHYAIALKYDQATMTAPKCVAKGENHLALKIRQIAEENGIPIYEDPPTARAIYKYVEIGKEILPQFYEAVSSALVFAYRMKKKVV